MLWRSADSKAQDTSWVYDRWSAKANIYFNGKPEVLDSNAAIFKMIKRTVLEYCRRHYQFNIGPAIIHTEAYRVRDISFTDDADPGL